MVDTNPLQIPFIQTMNSLVYLHLMMPPQAMKLRYVRQLTHRSVWLRRIPTQLTLKADFFYNLLSQFPDGQFLARTYIDMTITDLGLAILVSIFKIYIQ